MLEEAIKYIPLIIILMFGLCITVVILITREVRRVINAVDRIPDATWMNRVTSAVDRIPDKAWFSDVRASLRTLDRVAVRLDAAENRIKALERA